MKINKAKMMVSTLAIIAGAATVGSISGTVAWFQYNTRVTAAYVGTTASVSRNLQIRILDPNVNNYKSTEDNKFKTNLEAFDIKTYLAAKDALKGNDETKAFAKGSGQKITPVTYGKVLRDAELPHEDDFVNGPKGNPMAGQFAYEDWDDAAHDNYVTLPLQLKLVDGKGANLSGKNIYLTDLKLQRHSGVAEANDMSSALRVHFASSTAKQLWSSNGATVDTSKALDLDGDGINDKIRDRYIFNDNSINQATLPDGVYGDAKIESETRVVDNTAKITSYSAAGKNDADSPMADDRETAALNTTNALPLGATDSNGLLTIDVTIWFEGWALLTDYSGTGTSSVWEAEYAGKSFDVGMSFATPNVG